MTHTPGPWHKGTASVWAKAPTSKTTIKIAAISPEPGLSQREANARLIAAAPELLAACERAVDFLELDPHAAGGTLARLYAAIAKAKGGAA